jgi:drug/metabolite transporter (DMT)-like permease
VTGILLGLAAALCWGLSSLVGSRGARALGTTRNLAFAVVGGLVVVAPPAAVTAPRHLPPASTFLWLAVAACGSLSGLWAMLNAYRLGALSVVSPIVACQGVTIAVLGVLAGDSLRASTATLLAIASGGVVLVTRGVADAAASRRPATPPRAIASAIGAAVGFGIGLFGAARAGETFGAFVPGLGVRLLGLAVLTVPALVASRGRLPPRTSLRYALANGVLDVGGQLCFVGSALTGSVAVAGVLSSQGAAIGAALGVLLLDERLARIQALGFALILAAVTALAAGA